MATTIRRVKRFVQKAARAGGLSEADTILAEQIVLSITRNGNCHLSEVARMLNRAEPLIDTERELSEQLAARDSTLDAVRDGWLQIAAPAARRMSFITVDGTDHIKQYGKAFEFLDTVRDASDRLKRIEYGYWSVQIDAVDQAHGHLPLCSEVFSTKAPDYKTWYDAFLRPMLKVIAAVGREHTWLFDRGFDAIDFLRSLMALRIHWVVRQQQTRHVVLGDGELVPMHMLAAGLRKPHSVEVPYVNKSTHAVEHASVSFGFAPVRLPEIDAALTMIVIDGGRDEDIVLLTSARITDVDQAASIVLAYMRRWGSEEATRAFKQLTGVEDFRVRRWTSIRRLTFLAMMTCGVQALLLVTRPAIAARYIARVKQFIENVLLQHYRLWLGIADALFEGG
jgi:hypothetical protein